MRVADTMRLLTNALRRGICGCNISVHTCGDQTIMHYSKTCK